MTTVNWRQFDLLILFASLGLLVLGTALIYSGALAQFNGDEPILTGPVGRQLLYAVVGLVALFVLARIDYRSWSAVAPLLYAGALLMLVVVLAVGIGAHGSRRWVMIAGIQFQPSEPAKLVTIMLLARLLTTARGRALSGRTFLLTLLVTCVPALLVFVEPDLGTAVVFMAIWFGMVYIAGARLRHLALLAGVGLVVLPFVAVVALHGYQRERIAIFVDPQRDPLGTGFNINQAAISIGSGGLTGKGLTEGTQTQLDFLRTQTTDYIFSVLGEELGFAGAMLLFFLFLVLLLRGLRIASRASDSYGRLLAAGVVIMILAQVFINIGVNVRLFPVTGIPLPFISQGGSSLVSMFMAVGLLQSVALRRRAARYRGQARDRLALPAA